MRDVSRLRPNFRILRRELDGGATTIAPYGVPANLMGYMPGTPVYPTMQHPWRYSSAAWPYRREAGQPPTQQEQYLHAVQAWGVASDVFGLEVDSSGIPLENARNAATLEAIANQAGLTVEQLGQAWNSMYALTNRDPAAYRNYLEQMKTAINSGAFRQELGASAVPFKSGQQTVSVRTSVVDDEKKKEDEFPWGWVAAGVGGLALLGGGIYVATRPKRKRRRR